MIKPVKRNVYDIPSGVLDKINELVDAVNATDKMLQMLMFGANEPEGPDSFNCVKNLSERLDELEQRMSNTETIVTWLRDEHKHEFWRDTNCNTKRQTSTPTVTLPNDNKSYTIKNNGKTVTLPTPNTTGQTVIIKAGEEKVFVTMSTGKDKTEWVEQDKEMSTTTSGTKPECEHEWLWNHSFNGAFEDKYVCKKCGEIIEPRVNKDKEPVDKEVIIREFYCKDKSFAEGFASHLLNENEELLAVIREVYELAINGYKSSTGAYYNEIVSKLEKYVKEK